MVAFRAAHAAGAGIETDGWLLADGTPVIFHDDQLCRVVDPATLPAGRSCHIRITSLTLPQFRALRMNGGAPGVTVKALVRWSGRHHVPVMLENKKRLGYAGLPPATVAGWIHHWNAPVSVYETPKRVGPDHHLAHPAFATYGIRTGVKYLGAAHPTPAEIDQAGFSFTITSTEMLTRSYVVTAHHYGTEVGNYNSGQAEVWARLVNAGVDYILSPHPGRTERWLS
jgi:glycerophosphoryl diester phosphodiesterase